ncbi:MAG: hypothetical protein H7Y20_02780 [Bryobacteraceae bacterium]|nr:hypothetical protein [Bryobacteraceae bacterium]
MSRAGKHIVLTVVAVLLLGLSYPIYVTGVAFNVWQPLIRPLGVSRRARHVSTFKGGRTWFDCAVDSRRNVNVCQVWDEQGRLIAFGKYRVDGENRAATRNELRPHYVHPGPNEDPKLAWIILAGSRDGRSFTLVPVNDAGQPLERFEVH